MGKYVVEMLQRDVERTDVVILTLVDFTISLILAKQTRKIDMNVEFKQKYVVN